MLHLALLDQITSWWDGLNLARQLFYGIGLVAVLVALVLAVLGFIGLEHHDSLDAADTGVDDGGGGIFSIKPLTGFFLGFGWAGGLALDAGWPMIGAIATALAAGGLMMGFIVFMFRAIISMRSDGTVRIQDALGAIGTVYVTLPAANASGGQVIVNFNGRQETLAALNPADRTIASGEKIKVTKIIDTRTVVVEPLA
jgi:hypothetical protein